MTLPLFDRLLGAATIIALGGLLFLAERVLKWRKERAYRKEIDKIVDFGGDPIDSEGDPLGK